MPRSINGITYPTNLADVMKDKDLGRAFTAYAKKTAIDENIRFLQSKGNNRVIYENYLHPKGPLSVNIKSATRKAAEGIANYDPWTDPRWTTIILDAKAEVKDMVEQDHLEGGSNTFYQSEMFKAIHKASIKKARKGDPKKAAKLLGIDAKNMKILEGLMDAQALGDAKTAKALAEKLVKAEKLVMDYRQLLQEVDKMI